MDFRAKIIPFARVAAWRESLRAAGRRLVVTNGCFDLLHAGHVTYLESARAQGDALLVGLNGDASVRELKGPDRPVVPEADRALVLAGLGCVDAVCLFTEVRAHHFLTLAQPDVYVKGGDYSLATLNPDERSAVEAAGGQIVFLPFLPGRSTSGLLAKIQKL